MNLLALAARAACLAEAERLAQPWRSDSHAPHKVLVVRVPPRQPGAPVAWLFTGSHKVTYFRGSFPVAAP